MDNEQIYQFIEVVHGEEVLWNICHKDFKDSVGKNAKWTRIGSIFNMSGDEAYSKFRNLREKYRREKTKLNDTARSGAAASSGSKWPFMDHMKFVDECYKRRKVFNSNQWKAAAPPAHSPSPVPVPLPSPVSLPSPSPFPVLSPSPVPVPSPSPVSVPTPSPFPVLSPSPVPVPSLSPISVPSPEGTITFSVLSPSAVPVPSPLPVSVLPSSSVSAPSPPVFVRSTSPIPTGSTLPPLSFQVSSPSSENLSAAGAKRKNTSSLEQALSHSTNKIMEVMKSMVNKESQQPYEYVVQFIRQTLIEIGAERAKEMEKELMKIAFKFKYN